MFVKACKNCRLISDAETCPLCQGNEMTEKFSGHLVVSDPEKSEIGKKLGVKAPGTYAIKIRER
jgi:DNA-directed RNA polymerase subunit E"